MSLHECADGGAEKRGGLQRSAAVGASAADANASSAPSHMAPSSTSGERPVDSGGSARSSPAELSALAQARPARSAPSRATGYGATPLQTPRPPRGATSAAAAVASGGSKGRVTRAQARAAQQAALVARDAASEPATDALSMRRAATARLITPSLGGQRAGSNADSPATDASVRSLAPTGITHGVCQISH